MTLSKINISFVLNATNFIEISFPPTSLFSFLAEQNSRDCHYYVKIKSLSTLVQTIISCNEVNINEYSLHMIITYNNMNTITYENNLHNYLLIHT